MWYPLRNFFGDKAVYVISIVQVAILLAMVFVTAYFIRPQEAPILLHYSAEFGVDLSGPWTYAWRLPLLGFFIMVINGFLAYVLFYLGRPLSYFLLATTLAVEIILSVAVTLMIFLNI